MDNFKIIYKILKVFEKNLDVEEPDWEDLTPQKLNISEVLWQNLIQMLIKAGYIDGIKITSTATGTYITPINPQITLQGLQYLEENSMMRKAYRLAKGIKDITPGINIVNQARVTACFFIAQERAQYRAEAHDMEVSEQWKRNRFTKHWKKLRTVLTSSLLSRAKLTLSTTRLRSTARQESRVRQS